MPLSIREEPKGVSIQHVNTKNIIDHVPPMVYSINVDEDEGIFLQKEMRKFNLPEKVYGDLNEQKRVILHEHSKHPKATGVLLTGMKGSGKTLLAEMLGQHFINSDMPVLLVKSCMPVGLLESIINIISPCLVMIDEFGKKYSKDSSPLPDQQDLLTLFSGSSIDKDTMFIAMDNCKENINEFYINRPGRFLIHREFTGVDVKAVEEMIEGLDIDVVRRMVLLANAAFTAPSFDVISTMIRLAEEVEGDTLDYIEYVDRYFNMRLYVDRYFNMRLAGDPAVNVTFVKYKGESLKYLPEPGKDPQAGQAGYVYLMDSHYDFKLGYVNEDLELADNITVTLSDLERDGTIIEYGKYGGLTFAYESGNFQIGMAFSNEPLKSLSPYARLLDTLDPRHYRGTDHSDTNQEGGSD